VILWGDATRDFIKQLFSFDTALGDFFHLPWNVKLHMLYLGGAMMLIGLIIYKLRCPRLIRKFADVNDYWEHAISIKSPHILVDCIKFAARNEAINRIVIVGPELLGEVQGFLRAIKSLGEVPFDSYPELGRVLDSKENFGKRQYIEAAHLLTYHASVAYQEGSIRGRLTDVLSAQFSFEQRSRPWFAFASNMFGYTGALLFFIPSFETFVRVLFLYVSLSFAW
jgi:hypothetical protein